MIKVYENLDEALKEIESSGERMDVMLEFVKGTCSPIERDPYLEEKITPFFLSIANRLLEFGVKEHSEIQFNIGSIFLELTINAYRHGVRNPDERCSSHFYLGTKGVLSGTRQSNNFLTEEQISQLMKNGRIPQLYPGEGAGWGLEVIMEDGDGILILPEESAIYVSKLYK